MANHQARMSMYSMTSDSAGGPRGAGQQSTQVSTTTLLNAVHNIYLSSQPYSLDAGTSLVVNSWLSATQTGPDGKVGGTVDATIAARAWEHARRRAEDGCIVLGFVNCLPCNVSPQLGG
jgi:chitin synthase